MNSAGGNQLALGVAPVCFSDDRVRIGRIAPETQDLLRDIRRDHRRTHAFRFDARSEAIVNIGVNVTGLDQHSTIRPCQPIL